MGFSRQEYWMGCHVLFQWIFLTQGLSPWLLCLLHWQMGSLLLAQPGKLAWQLCIILGWSKSSFGFSINCYKTWTNFLSNSILGHHWALAAPLHWILEFNLGRRQGLLSDFLLPWVFCLSPRVSDYSMYLLFLKSLKFLFLLVGYPLDVVVVQLLSHVQIFATPWTAACQASLSLTPVPHHCDTCHIGYPLFYLNFLSSNYHVISVSSLDPDTNTELLLAFLITETIMTSTPSHSYDLSINRSNYSLK